jgi:hypothetical protein
MFDGNVIALSTLLHPTRLHGESATNYRHRRRLAAEYLKEHGKGKLIHVSKKPGQKKGRTYVKPKPV